MVIAERSRESDIRNNQRQEENRREGSCERESGESTQIEPVSFEQPAEHRVKRKKEAEKNGEVNRRQRREHEEEGEAGSVAQRPRGEIAVEKQNRKGRPAHCHRLEVKHVAEVERAECENKARHRGTGAIRSQPASQKCRANSRYHQRRKHQEIVRCGNACPEHSERRVKDLPTDEVLRRGKSVRERKTRRPVEEMQARRTQTHIAPLQNPGVEKRVGRKHRGTEEDAAEAAGNRNDEIQHGRRGEQRDHCGKPGCLARVPGRRELSLRRPGRLGLQGSGRIRMLRRARTPSWSP